jgi:GNAT superfamily N-acetyltransferase
VSNTFRIERFGPDLRDAFDRLHSDPNGATWCHCVAWWVPTWDGWGERTAADNAALRASLCDRGEYDGLLAFEDAEPVGWCQLGRRDRLEKLMRQFELEPDADAWAVTCFLVAPTARGRGVARRLLEAAIETARDEGARRLEGYPRREGSDPAELWTGSAALFAEAGFASVRDAGPRLVVSRDLA